MRSRDGEPEIVLVHVEVQAETEVGFGRRMFEYYSLLWLHFETSPLGAALAALMLREKDSAELELRARMLQRVVSSRLDEGRQYLLVNLIETYFELSAEEREPFRRLVSSDDGTVISNSGTQPPGMPYGTFS